MTQNPATRHTLTFAQTHLPPPPARLLEVGCGDGELAHALGELGYEVVAVDSSAEPVETARGKGVDARVATFPDFEASPFDAILFTRSLHHVSPLDEALERARDLLSAGGTLLVEDWAWERVDAATAEWAYGLRATLSALGLVSIDGWEYEDSPRTAWHREHEHHIHTSGAMLEAVSRMFEVEAPEKTQYFYRYYVRDLASEPAGAEVARCIMEWERRLIEAGAIQPIGLRLQAGPRPMTDHDS